MKDNHIKRELYLKKIEDFIDTDFTKVLTGIRCCGKTSIMYDIGSVIFAWGF